MSFAGALAVIKTHLTASGTAITPPITDIGYGEPAIPAGRVIRFWYEGDGPPMHFGGRRTLTDQMVGERVTVRAYWNVPNRDKSPAEALEVDVQAWVRSIKNRLIGDSTLGGNCVDLDVGNADTGWAVMDSGVWRTATVPLVLDFVDVDTIAP